MVRSGEIEQPFRTGLLQLIHRCMVHFLPSIFSDLPSLSITAIIDVVVVAILIYQFLLIIRGRRAVHVLLGLCVLGVIYAIAVWANLQLLHTILATLIPYTPIALIVMFQAELRRALARLGRRPFLGISQLERRELSQEVMLAVSRLAQTKVGALIVIERKIGLRTFVESGVSLDAIVSRDLLCSIFFPGATLHDGAVIIQGDRLAAAACFLPLTTNPLLMTELGTRHRAAIGISEESDAIAIVVSEETGKVSIATFGEIELDVPLDRVEHLLSERVDRDEKRSPASQQHNPAPMRQSSLDRP